MDATPPITKAARSGEPARTADSDVLALLAQGQSEAAFGVLAGRYSVKVYRLCLALLRNSEAAQDAAQESLVRVWRALPRYDGRASLATWIYAITRNRCLTALAQPRPELSLSDEAVLAEAETVPEDAADPDGAGLVRRLVAELPEPARRVLTLNYFEDCAVGEVSRMLGMPDGTVKTHLHRARTSLMARLRGLGLDAPQDWFQGGQAR